MKLVALVCVGLFATLAYGEEAVVIDSKLLGEQPATSKTNEVAPVPAPAPADTTPIDSQADMNLQRTLKGGKLSIREKTALAKAEMAKNNLTTSEEFLVANKAKPGVVTLPSGVQYKILRAGKGKKATDNSNVDCRYRGMLVDGTEFEKTDAKKPSALKVSGFLPGLKEAIKLMPAGSKWEIVVPPQLAYGPQGNRGVAPNAVLIYEMEILGVR